MKQYKSPPAMVIDPKKTYTATFELNDLNGILAPRRLTIRGT